MAVVLALLAACDKEPASKGQAQPATTAIRKTRADFGLESANGMRATLTYRFAGKTTPDALFTGADGSDVSLTDFAGKPLLVNLWATWCAPCKAEMPTLDALAALEEGKISVIVISQDLEGLQPVHKFFANAGIQNLKPYTDPDNLVLRAFGNNIALPTTILYNSDGHEVWRVIGGVEWDDGEISKLLSEAA